MVYDTVPTPSRGGNEWPHFEAPIMIANTGKSNVVKGLLWITLRGCPLHVPDSVPYGKENKIF